MDHNTACDDWIRYQVAEPSHYGRVSTYEGCAHDQIFRIAMQDTKLHKAASGDTVWGK